MRKVIGDAAGIKVVKKVTNAGHINVSADWREAEIVRVDRAIFGNPVDGLQGLLISESTDWLYTYVVDQLVIPNGFALLRRDTVSDVDRCDRSEFMKKALKLKGYELPKPPEIDLSSARSILTSLMSDRVLATIYTESIDPDVVYIGYIKVVGDVFFELSSISSSAKKYSENDRFKLSDCTRMDFGGEYERALQLVSDHNRSSE